MVSILDSEAVFSEKALECGLSRAIITVLTQKGFNTIAKIAYSVGQPGETPTEAQLRDVVTAPTGDPNAATAGTVSSIRRLIFESQTHVVSRLKAMVESREDQLKAELAQRGRLGGLDLVGELECGHACYDQVMRMLQQNAVVYLAPHLFISRKAELGKEKAKKELVLDSLSQLTVREQGHDLHCDTSTELQLQYALTRRSLALDLVGAATFSVAENFNRFLMSQLQAEPPAGYSKATVSQLLRADKEGWLRLAETLTSGVRRNAQNQLPLDLGIPALQSDPKVMFHLLPLPSSAPRSWTSADAQPHEFDEPKGKGKGKKRKWKAPKNMPQDLKSKQSETKGGKPLCWNFNLKHGCSGAKAGGKCQRGLHLCMEPGCQKPHPLHEHGNH